MTTKIYVIVDALGNPLTLSLTGGHAHDITQAEPESLIAGKGYDSDGFIESLEVRAIAMGYEKTARNFLAGLHLVCALAWLK